MVFFQSSIKMALLGLLTALSILLAGCTNQNLQTTKSSNILRGAQSQILFYGETALTAHLGKAVEFSPQATLPTSILSVQVTPALPAGLTIGNDGIIKGTPTATSPLNSYSISAKSLKDSFETKIKLRVVEESSGLIYSLANERVVTGQAIEIKPEKLPIDGTFESIDVSPKLPIGLTIDETGVISGTPTEPLQKTDYTVLAISGTKQYSANLSFYIVTIASGLSYAGTTFKLTSGQLGTIAPNSIPTTSFDKISVSPNLPTGVTISSAGVISGTPTSGLLETTYTVTGQSGTTEYPATVKITVKTIGSGFSYNATTDELTVNQAVSIAPLAIPVTSFESISTSPNLPTGLTISSSGVLSGTPTSSLAETSYTVIGVSGTTEYSATIKLEIFVVGTGFAYNASGFNLLKNESINIQPDQMPVSSFESIIVTPNLPSGLSINNQGHITGAPASSSALANFTITATSGLVKYHGTLSLRVSTPTAIAATVTPLTETSIAVSWIASNATGLNGHRVEITNSDGSKSRYFESESSTGRTISGLTPGGKVSVRVRGLLDPPNSGDSTDLVSDGWTPFGAINADTASTVPQEPWKPSGLEGLAISENFSIVWSFYWNPGFTPAWKGIPTKDQKGDFYFNTSLNRAYQNTNGLLWGDTGSRDDVTQIWTNGVDKFIVGTWRGRLHLWDHLPNTPDSIAHSREIGLGSTTRSTLSGAASACFDSTVNKLFVTNGGRNRVLVFNGWPTTTNPDAEFVLGQADFDASSAATTATGMNNPWTLSCDGGILAVGDLGNNRVLVWTKPITANNQAADFIYGQSNATSSGANGAGGVNTGGVAHPRAVLLVPRSTGGYALVVADTTQNRVVEWDRIPATPASQTFPGTFDRVYGQPNRSSVTANADGQSMSSMAGPVALSVERDKNGVPKPDTFWVADGAYWTTHNSRILKFQRGNSTAVDLWGDANGTTSLSGWTYPKDRVGFWWANYVNFSRIGCLGSQGVFNMGGYIWKTAPANGVAPSDFTDSNRCHTATAGGKTWVANGASLWGLDVASGVDAPSPLSGSPVLLGRKNADGTDNTGIADSYEFKISGVGDMASSGNSLLVLDGNRIAIWNTSGIANHSMVTAVIGQSSKTTNDANQGGISAKTLNGPSTMIIHQGKIIVADRGNHRVMIWNTIPTSDYQAADVILGQADGTSNATGTGLGNFNTPTSAAVINGKLVVTDRGNHRVLVWNTIPTVSGQAASKSIDLRDYRFSLPAWYNPHALSPVWIRAYQDRVYVEQYGRVLVIPDIF